MSRTGVRRTRIIAAGLLFGLAVVAFALVWLGLRGTDERSAARLWVHSETVLLEDQRLLSALQDAETGERGYLITGQPGYLAPYESGRRGAIASLDRLAALTRDNPAQGARIARLRELVTARLDDLHRAVALMQGGDRTGAAARVATGQGKLLMDEARALVAAISAEETRLLAERHAAAEIAAARDRGFTNTLATLGLLALLGAGIAAGFALRASARARLSAAIAASEERLRMFVERTPAAIAMFDRQMRYLAVSRRYMANYGIDGSTEPEELIGRSHYDVFPEIPPRWRDIHRRVLAGETLAAEDDPFPRADGRTDWVRWEMAPWRAGDAIGGVMLVSEVITARKEAERQRAFLLDLADRLRAAPRAAMAETTALLGGYFAASRVGYGEVDDADETIVVNHEYSDGTVAPAVGTHRTADFGAAFAAALRDGRMLVVNDVVADPRTRAESPAYMALATRSMVVVPLLREGRPRATLYLAHRDPRAWQAEEVRLLQDVAARVWSVIEQARAEAARERAMEEFRTLADGIPTLCWMADPDGSIYWYNKRWYDYTGTTFADMAGWGWQAVHDPHVLPAVLDRWRASVATGQPFEMTFPLRGADGTLRPFLTRVAPVHGPDGTVRRWLGINTDVSEAEAREDALRRSEAALRTSEAQLRRLNEELETRVREEVAAREAAQARLAHAQRMEALGQLAGGIAHDFNNVLQAVQGGARLIEGKPADTARVSRLAAMVAEAAERGTAVTRRLLAFSRRADLRAEPLDAAALLAGMREVLAHMLGAGVTIEVAAAPDLPRFLADRGQLETVLVNLATNARDAMAGQGTLTLAAAPISVGVPAARTGRLAAGAYLCLTASDTGAGMAPDVLARASEPFFTTKPPGKGTGLGLAMARGFAEQSGGAFAIDSTPGQGTTVCLWFPAVTGPPPGGAGSAPRLRQAPGNGRVRVLLVDDEALARDITAEQLDAADLAVRAVANAQEALDRLDAGEDVDVLVTDLSMPGMDGLVLIREAQRRRPGLPAILLTGFVTDAAELAIDGATSGCFTLLRKPVAGEMLARRIAGLLGAAGATPP